MTKKPSREDLVRMYWGEEMLQSQIAERVGTNQQAVSRWMKTYNVPVRRAANPNRCYRSLASNPRAECYLAKARQLMRGEVVDPSCGGGYDNYMATLLGDFFRFNDVPDVLPSPSLAPRAMREARERAKFHHRRVI